ncbi:ATP-binding protein [Vibrio nomapromontoriensis]|uniref:ATP-binding protein n=1 Tax=Vibrio nomapromontoriensis TaxID=2910246 RepID=UPI003D136D62
MTKLILIRGLPGSGKSTLAQTLSAFHVEADMFFVNDSGVYQYDATRIEDAHRWCQSQAEEQLSRGNDVVVANTFIRRWEMKAYQQMAKRYGAEIEIRVCRGRYANIHGVEQVVIDKMRRRWQD